MGLSPLNPAKTSDLHVSNDARTSTGVSLGFIRAGNRSSPFGSYRSCSISAVSCWQRWEVAAPNPAG